MTQNHIPTITNRIKQQSREIHLNLFKPRLYQLNFCKAFEEDGYKKIVITWPRRSGKDLTAFNLLFRQAIRSIGNYFYMLPSYSQGRKVIWQSLSNDGKRFIDFIPKELIRKTNEQSMQIYLVNGSVIQIVGSTEVDRLVGTNIKGVVFSEYALSNPDSYKFIRPILIANDGFAIFISTPRGKNSFYDLFKLAERSPDWYAEKLTLDDTKHIDPKEIQNDIEQGIMSEDLAQQEYWCSFSCGIEGAYYSKYLNQATLEGRIGNVGWDPTHLVHTACDIGYTDHTSIIFFQYINNTVRVIDCYEKNKEPLTHYINIIKSRGYTLGKHIAPPDIKVTEYSSGVSRLQIARSLGINFIIAPRLRIEDGIEACRALLPRTFFDETNSKGLVKALSGYRQDYDSKKQIYKKHPRHDQCSHFADAFRYLAVTLNKLNKGSSTPEELEKRFLEAKYGSVVDEGRFFAAPPSGFES